MGLLPEINKRRLYEQKGFGSICEFAYKLAGLSEAQVRRSINLEKKFENFPSLHRVLVEGEVSVNKLGRVASIASSENEKQLAEAVIGLPQAAVETMVRDLKIENGLEAKCVRAHTFELSKELMEKLTELAEKGLDPNEILMELLERREVEIQEEKEEIAAEVQVTTSRYVPVKVRRVLKREYGDKCSISTCKKPAEHIHHKVPFSLEKKHDPRFLAPLCKAHHTLAHGVNLKARNIREEFSSKMRDYPDFDDDAVHSAAQAEADALLEEVVNEALRGKELVPVI